MNTPSAILQSEEDFLSCINALFPERHASMPLGRGDDCAVLQSPEHICISTDLFLENVHFRRSYFTPEEIGHKALAVNLSDIAAMGAKPLGFSMALMVPPHMPRDYMERMMAGMAALAQRHDVPLTGGDISRSASLGFSITVWGAMQNEGRQIQNEGHQALTKPAPSRGFLQRGTCHTGDIIFIVGHLGLARIGLLALEKEGKQARQAYPTACAMHLMPQPYIEAGLCLARHEGISLMDLSDGLARDIPRLLGSGHAGGYGHDAENIALGAALSINADLVHTDILAFAQDQRAQGMLDHEKGNTEPSMALHHAFEGGEDYALLGACSPATFAQLQNEARINKALEQLHAIGTVTTSGLITLNGHPVTSQGFDHFAPKA